MLTDLAWDRVSERKPPQRAGYASLSNTAQNASLPVSQSFLAEPLLQRFLWASCWCRQFFFFCFLFFCRKTGPGLPVGVKAVDPALASSESVCNDFIQPHSVQQRGATRIDVALPTLIPLRNPRPIERHWSRVADVFASRCWASVNSTVKSVC